MLSLGIHKWDIGVVDMVVGVYSICIKLLQLVLRGCVHNSHLMCIGNFHIFLVCNFVYSICYLVFFLVHSIKTQLINTFIQRCYLFKKKNVLGRGWGTSLLVRCKWTNGWGHLFECIIVSACKNMLLKAQHI